MCVAFHTQNIVRTVLELLPHVTKVYDKKYNAPVCWPINLAAPRLAPDPTIFLTPTHIPIELLAIKRVLMFLVLCHVNLAAEHLLTNVIPLRTNCLS